MLLIAKKSISGSKSSWYAALTLSFVSMGDAFLYPFLPQNANSLYIPVAGVGVLLSINRFVRIVINPWVMHLFAKYGFRHVTIVAAIIAVICTIGYGLDWGLISLILFRLSWGIAFSILRMSTLAYAFENENIGFSLGTSRSIQELGPLLALFVGPILLSYFSAQTTFFYLAIFSLPGLFYAIRLPELDYAPSDNSNGLLCFPSISDVIIFLVAFTVEGLLIVAIGLFLVKNDVQLTSWMIVTLSAGYLAYRRICFILFSPAGGVIADKVGVDRVFNISLLLICIGLVLLLFGWSAVGLIMIFTFNSVTSALGPASASNHRKDKLRAVSMNATWRDIGAATGTLVGGLFLASSLIPEVFIIATFMLLTSLIVKLQINKNSS